MEPLDHELVHPSVSVMKRIIWMVFILALLAGCADEVELPQEKKHAGLTAPHEKDLGPFPTDLSFLDQGLVAYYPFDGSASDRSGNDHNTTVHGAVLSADRQGSPNKAYSFDGIDDYIVVNDATALRPNHITIACWISSAASGRMVILGKTTHADAQAEQYGLSLIDLTPTFSIKRNSGGVSAEGWHQVNVPSGIALTQWSHLAATWNGLKLKIYLNGELRKQNAEVPAGPIDNLIGGDLQIGRWLLSHPFHFAGKMDEIRIYNRALSSQEVAAMHRFEK